MRTLKRDEAACNNYILDHPTCSNCLRNINFAESDYRQNWGTFDPKTHEGSFKIECDGFIDKTQPTHISGFEVEA